ncbi:MAG: IPT/TIG domain-containing protein [Candidatus Dormibacter sp.]|uniref:IPT/TIG domain-containing protein n=1 Tax=Candidatus Dormibacter sp. TaxID=2973982 RepID=UPI000DB5D682|nr:MAG: hypothetical protein DLM66_09910 [Candidatus Dormibacteraeota bacterium]
MRRRPAAWLPLLLLAFAPLLLGATPTPPPTPVPTPIPPSPVLNISPTSGPPGTKVTVTGSNFPANQPVPIYIDSPERQLGVAKSDAAGNLAQAIVVIPNGIPEGSHVICGAAGVQPACGQFQAQPAPTPTPTAVPTPTPTAVPSPTPTETPSASPSATPVAGSGSSGGGGLLGSLFRFPFILFPLLLLLALAAAIFLIVRSRRTPPGRLPPTVVTHRGVGPAGNPYNRPGTPGARLGGTGQSARPGSPLTPGSELPPAGDAAAGTGLETASGASGGVPPGTEPTDAVPPGSVPAGSREPGSAGRSAGPAGNSPVPDPAAQPPTGPDQADLAAPPPPPDENQGPGRPAAGGGGGQEPGGPLRPFQGDRASSGDIWTPPGGRRAAGSGYDEPPDLPEPGD